MCQGFSIIATADSIYFIEPDTSGDNSHSEVLRRLGWKENGDQFNRKFVRIEFSSWKPLDFVWDEESSLPDWANEEVMERAIRLLNRVFPIVEPFLQHYSMAYNHYDQKRNEAHYQRDIEQDDILERRHKQQLRLDKKFADDRLAYQRAGESSYRYYRKLERKSRNKWSKVIQGYREEYRNSCREIKDELVKALSSIAGYVPEK